MANYGIKLWGTNAAFFVPQGAAGVPHAAPPPPHPPSAAAPPGVHAQVAQNGTVYYLTCPIFLNLSRYLCLTLYLSISLYPILVFNQGQLGNEFHK